MSILHEVLVERVDNLSARVEKHREEVDREFARVRGALEAGAEMTEKHADQLSDIKIWRAKIAGIFVVLVPLSGFISAIVIHYLEKFWK